MSEPIKTEAAAATGRKIRESGDRVHQIAVPPTARALSTLSPIDYADAFLVEADLARQSSAEQCGRAVLDGAPLAVRTNLLLAWSAIGLKPAIGESSRSILGWEIRVSAPEFVLLGRDSLIGSRVSCSLNASTTHYCSVRSCNTPITSHDHYGPRSSPGMSASCVASSRMPADGLHMPLTARDRAVSRWRARSSRGAFYPPARDVRRHR